MRADTSTVLRAFFRPLNGEISVVTGRREVLWKDVKTGGGGVSRGGHRREAQAG